MKPLVGVEGCCANLLPALVDGEEEPEEDQGRGDGEDDEVEVAVR